MQVKEPSDGDIDCTTDNTEGLDGTRRFLMGANA